MKNILVSNDDGYTSKGIEILIKAASNFGVVYVSAPISQQSGKSQAIDISRIIEIREIPALPNSQKTIIAEATPAQALANGVSYFSDIDFDLVLSGINEGLNLAMDISYSGTVGVIKEATILGIPAIAFSAEDVNASFLEDEVYKLLDEILRSKDHLHGVPLNVNIPKDKPLGVKYTKMGLRRFHTEIQPRANENEYDRLLSRKFYDEHQEADVLAVDEGYVSITPITLDQTNHQIHQRLKNQKKR